MEHIACFQENPSIGLKFWYNICTTLKHLTMWVWLFLHLYTAIWLPEHVHVGHERERYLPLSPHRNFEYNK